MQLRSIHRHDKAPCQGHGLWRVGSRIASPRITAGGARPTPPPVEPAPDGEGQRTHPYEWTLHASIDEVDACEWAEAGAQGLMMDRRFLSVVEATMAGDLIVWHAIFREGGRPIACASFGLYHADAGTLATPWLRRLVTDLRRLFPRLGFFEILFCGLPVSIGQKTIGISERCDPSKLAEALSALMEDLARTHGASLQVAKEFTASECVTLDSLLGHGFLRGATPSLYTMARRHDSFSAYLTALKSDYRGEINRSKRKFAKSGLRVEQVHGAYIAEVYTDQIHALYEAVARGAEHRLEVLPAMFFRELALTLPEAAVLTLVKESERVVAFSFSLNFENCYYFMFLGLDYKSARQSDVYFNIFYNDMETWFESGAMRVQMGQASDEFKARLGCRATSLFCYAKATGALGPLFRIVASQLFPPRTTPEPRDVFKA